MTFALNHLGYYLLTTLLLDLLKDSAPARVVNVSSKSHLSAGRFRLEDLPKPGRNGGYRAYGRSKLCNILFTYELARRLEGSGVTVNDLHPGLVRTNIARDNGLLGRVANFFIGVRGVDAPKGSGDVDLPGNVSRGRGGHGQVLRGLPPRPVVRPEL